MTKLAYTPKQAAKAAAVNVALIKDVIRTRDLPAHDAENEPIVLHADLKAWVASLPAWKS